jgi:hypothetical protein
MQLQVSYCMEDVRDDSSSSINFTSPTQSSSSSTTSKPTSTMLEVPPGPTQSGIAPDCNRWVMQKDGVYCVDMATKAGITLDNFYAWNPAVKKDCSGLWIGYAYCVGVKGSSSSPNPTSTPSTPTGPPPPGPTQPGVTPNCKKWALQKSEVYCYDMSSAAGITLDQFYAWNPAVKNDCSGLWVGYAYCVGI